MDRKKSSKRLEGIDLARSFAIFGMVVVNFKIAMGAKDSGDPLLSLITSSLEGRAAALFVVLAGVGISLLTNTARAESPSVALSTFRKTLLKRALFLWIAGLLYTPLWPADILHFYGVYLLIGCCFLAAGNRIIIAGAVFFVLAFPIMISAFDYSAEWDFETLTYAGFWTVPGMIKHVFFNGFHPVFPWVAFLLWGMWLGRQNLHDKKLRNRILLIGAASAVVFETASRLLIKYVTELEGVPAEDVYYLWHAGPMPPMPFYVGAATATATAFLMICLNAADEFPKSSWVHLFSATGRLALTLYVAHVVVGMGSSEILGMMENQSLDNAVFAAFLFCLGSIGFAHFWTQKFKRGPLEWLMRKMT